MPAPELGTKQICPTCQAKFYDLNRRPAHCPKCASDFDPDEAVKTRRVRARTAVPDYEADEAEDQVAKKTADEDEDEVEEVTPEIDAAAEAEPLETDEDADDVEPGVAPGGDDLGVDFEEEEEDAADADDESVPFLEEEEDDLDEGIEGLPEGDDGDER